MAMPRRVDSVYSRVFERSARAGEASRVRAFEQAFNSIDSARDIEAWEGIRADVLDAIEALDIEYPSDRMQAAIPPEANTELERHVDQLIRAEITHELGSREGAAATRASVMRTQLLRKWRSMLLLRQVGLALGWIASRAAVEAWLAEQANALLGGASRSPLALGDGVRALILPQMNSTEYWLAPLRPRIYNLTGDPPANTVLVSLPIRSLYVEIVARGDNLMAEVLAYSSPRRPPETVATLVIDLPIAREAILHAGGDLPSFTEIGESAFARIERARASLVGRVRMKEAAVYFTDDLKRRYRIIPNPASLAQPLRVEPVVGGS
jgi:hypothetical protein